jgi:hypothetical protein
MVGPDPTTVAMCAISTSCMPPAEQTPPCGSGRTTGPVTSSTATDSGRVLTLAAGSATQTVLPFSGLNTLSVVAVDTASNLYVADMSNSRVVKLPAV